jgi:hypothetical protein
MASAHQRRERARVAGGWLAAAGIPAAIVESVWGFMVSLAIEELPVRVAALVGACGALADAG